jgi:Holliday junction resolvase RusA-like endonuclease
MIKFEIPGEAKGKGRPKFFRRGDFVGTYTPDKTASYENLVKLSFKREYPSLDLLKGAIEMRITVNTSIPKSYSAHKRKLALFRALRPTKKPDLDNIAKIIADSLNGIAYEDDKQIVSLRVDKYYSEKPLVGVEIAEVI